MQMTLFEEMQPLQEVRPIHYLGSKLRLLGPINRALAEVLEPRGTILDLFSGSGTVSYSLSSTWSVVAVDVQEYSRVLCSALLSSHCNSITNPAEILSAAFESPVRTLLSEALSAVVAFERDALEGAAQGKIDDLCDLTDQGSLMLQTAGEAPITSSVLSGLLLDAASRLKRMDMYSGPDTVITRYFGGVYFSWTQSIELDALLSIAHSRTSVERDLILAAVMGAASEAVNTVGKHFAQPLRIKDKSGRPKRHLIRQTVRDRSMNVAELFETYFGRLSSLPRPLRSHTAIRLDFREALSDASINFDAVYADPPYTRDHYSRFYHVLETMARHDEPKISTSKIRTGGEPKASRGMYRLDRHQSPFSIKSQAPDAFRALFRGVKRRKVPLVLSYSPYSADSGNRPRVLTLDELVSLASEEFAGVEVRELGEFAHNKLNKSDRNVAVNYDAEVLLICRP